MPPKKEKKGKAPEFTPEDVDAFVKSYKTFCTQTGTAVYEPLVRQLTDDEDREEFMQNQQFIIHPSDPADPDEPRLGPGGCRAMCTSILALAPDYHSGAGHGTKAVPKEGDKPFKALKSMRIWHSRIGDDGACALAEVLRLGGAEVQLEYLEVFDSGVGSRGCRALGVSLMVGANKSLQTLRLDYNDQVGSEGCVNIARGLRSNVSLKQLHLPYCDIGPSAGQPLGEALAFPQIGLLLLNLEGNGLGDDGLALLCPGLARNASLLEVNLADNQIGGRPDALHGITEFAQVLSAHKTIATVNLNFNRLCPPACEALLPGLCDPADPAKPHPRLTRVIVDAGLVGISPELHERLNVEGGGGKKGGKKGKKKK